MNKYFPAYKCALCGSILKFKDAQPIPYDSLPALCGKVVANQQFAGNPYLHQVPMQVPCKCKDGSCGMAYFAGFKKE